MNIAVLIGLGILILAVGIGVGFLFGHILRMRETARAGSIEAELNQYRRDVTEHFNQTATHFQALGQQYRALYDHMGHSAEKLCDTSQLVSEVSFSRSAMLASVSETEATSANDPSAEEERSFDAENGADSGSENGVDSGSEPEPLREAGPGEEVGASDKVAATETAEITADPDPATESPESERIYH